MRTAAPYLSTPNSYLISGTALVYESYVQIRWGWVAFVASQLVLAVVLLAATMVSTRRLGVRVLKSNPLAMVFSLGAESRGLLSGIERPRDMRQKAAGAVVRLRDGELVLVKRDERRAWRRE